MEITVEANGLDVLKKIDNNTGETVFEMFEDDMRDININHFQVGRNLELSNMMKNHSSYSIDVWDYLSSDLYSYGDNSDEDDYRYYESEEDEVESLTDTVMSSNALFVQITTMKYTYVFLNDLSTLYRCSKCDELFADYKGRFLSYSVKRKKYNCYCSDCYKQEVYLSKERKKDDNIFKFYHGIAASRPQRYISELLGGKLNVKLGKFYPDITLDNIVIEYDGSGHDLSVKFGAITTDQFLKKEKIREEFLIKNGYKVIRIISEKDLLPSDTRLLEILEYSKEEFEKGKDVIVFYIDDMYPERQLRKINKSDLL